MNLERKGDGVRDKTPGFSADGFQEVILHRMPSLRGLNAKELPKKTENQQPEKWTENPEGVLSWDVKRRDQHREKLLAGLTSLM